MRFGSVCSGIEAASVAWHPLGWSAAWLAEIEPFPSAVLAHHYPDVPNLGDMSTLPARIQAGEVEAPDVFCGGTPCQAFSVAGLRRSLNDARGNLSLTFCEIADAIDTVRSVRGSPPAIVFWENVPGVLNTPDNAFGCFLAGLAGEDDPLEPPGEKWTNAGAVLGPVRAVAWRVLDAQYFGVAQRRRRVFVVASARNGFDPRAVLFEFDGLRRDTAPSRGQGQEPAAGTLRSTDGGIDVDHARAGHVVGPLTAACGPRGHGGSGLATDKGAEAGHILAFGGNRTSGSIDVTPALLAQPGSGWKGDFESETFLVQPTHTLRGEGFDASEDGTGRGTPLVPVEPWPGFARDLHLIQSTRPTPFVKATSPHSADEAPRYEQTELAACLNTWDERHNPPKHKLAQPVLSFKAGQSEAAGGTFVTEEYAPTLQAANNGSTAVPAIAFPANLSGTQHASTENLAPAMGAKNPTAVAFQPTADCLTAAYGTKWNGNASATNGSLFAGTAMQVRRLTPRECERLQGFPDDYTAIPWRGKPADQCPDGPRYKALGNSWAVPVVAWIGRRIDAAARAAMEVAA